MVSKLKTGRVFISVFDFVCDVKNINVVVLFSADDWNALLEWLLKSNFANWNI